MFDGLYGLRFNGFGFVGFDVVVGVCFVVGVDSVGFDFVVGFVNVLDGLG
jgi:hypothetical protein